MKPADQLQEAQTAEAFSKQSPFFDELDAQNPILVWMRTCVRNQMLELLHPGDSILELNAGTGLDSFYFAEKGFQVLATDLAPGMIETMKRKKAQMASPGMMQVQACSFNSLENISGSFDHIFSNFGGLNCAEDIRSVISQFSRLLNKGGKVTLVMMPPFCPWELLLALKGNFKTAFRRFQKHGALSHIEGVHFLTYYYSPSYIRKAFGPEYHQLSCRGLGITIPPPYLETFPSRYPRLFRGLIRIEEKICHTPPFRSMGDHFILSMQKKT